MDIDIVQKMFADIDTMKIKFVEGIEKNSALLAKKYKELHNHLNNLAIYCQDSLLSQIAQFCLKH